MEKKSSVRDERQICPICKSSKLIETRTIFIQCDNCKVLIDFNNDKLHVTECPLCSSNDLTILPSGNIRCEGCKNSFVAANKE